MDARLMFPSKYISAIEFKGRDVTLTIAAVKLEELQAEDGTKKSKGIVTFRETKKGLVVNRTNCQCFIAMFGVETDNWIGKRVTLFPVMVEAFGSEELATRVRGSPDLEKDIRASIELPRKKPRTMVLKKTTIKKRGAAPAPAPVAETETDMDPDTGEVPFGEDEKAQIAVSLSAQEFEMIGAE